jgi:hypothetical protein
MSNAKFDICLPAVRQGFLLDIGNWIFEINY